MKLKSELLIESLTKDSGRNVFSLKEMLQLQKIAFLEGVGETEELELKIDKFKRQFAVKDDEWLC